MKKPVVDYRQFRIAKRNDPCFSHLSLLWGWIIYFILYFLTEQLIPTSICYSVHCSLDDLIPFCEVFVIPYVGWYFMIIGSLIYFLLYNVDGFRDLQRYIIILQTAAMMIYVIIPSRQDLRPAIFPRDNILTDCVELLYSVDTNTGVCPSLHVAISIALASVWTKQRDVSVLWRGLVVISAVLICLSTMFIKQHSAVDFIVAIPVCLLAEQIVYGAKTRA